MTEYVILKATNESGTIFSIVGEQLAHSPEAAIRAEGHIWRDGDDKGIFAAVPKRSWTVVKIEREVKETFQVTRL